jgi:hypothetical protein
MESSVVSRAYALPCGGPGFRVSCTGAATLQAVRSARGDSAISCMLAWSACAHWVRCRPVSSQIE